MAGEALIQVMRQAAKETLPPESRTDIMFGTVSSTTPLVISVEGRFDIPESLMVLSPFCFDKTVKVDIPSLQHENRCEAFTIPAHDHSFKDDPDKKTDKNIPVEIKPSIDISPHPSKQIEVTVWSGLKKGDKVVLLRVAQGQQYIVLCKVGGF